MRTLWRWLRRTVLIIGIAALLATALYHTLLPVFVRQRLLAALRDAGFHEPRLVIRGVSPSAAHLAELSAGRERQLRAASLDATYNWAGLRRGRVETLVVTGASWLIIVRDGQVDWGLPEAPAQAGGGGGAADRSGRELDLPFDDLLLRASEVVIEWEGRTLRVPIDLRLQRRPASDWALDLRALVLGAPVRVEGLIGEPSAPAAGRGGAAGRAPPLPGGNIDLRVSVLGLVASITGAIFEDRESAELSARFPARGRVTGAGFDNLVAEAHYARARDRQSALKLTAAADRFSAGGLGYGVTGHRLAATAALAWGTRSAGDIEVEAETRWGALDVALHGRRGSAGAGEAQAAARVNIGADALEAWSALPASLAVRNLRWTDGEAAMEAEQLRLSLVEHESRPLLRATLGTTPAASFAGRIQTSDPIAVRSGAAQTSADSVAVAGSVHWRQGAALTAEGDAALAGGILDAPAASLSVADVAASVPITLNRRGGDAGEFRVGSIRWRDQDLPPLAGTLAVHDGRARAAARWPLGERTLITAAAAADVLAPLERLAAQADLPPSILEPDHPLARIIRALAGVEVTGEVSAAASVSTEDGRLRPSLQVSLANASLAHPDSDAVAEGVVANVTFTSLAPPATPGRQEVRVRSLRSGESELGGGEMLLRLEETGTLLVEELHWSLGEEGGGFSAFNVPIYPGAERIDVTLFIEELPVREWIGFISGDRVRGEGRLYGRLPLTIRPGRPQLVQLHGGFLYATTPRGWFEFEGGKDVVADLLREEIQDPDPMMGDIKRRAVQALTNFEYTTFRFDVIREDGEAVGRLFTAGRGRDGRDPIPIGGLTLNIHEFDGLINSAVGTTLRTHQLLQRIAVWLAAEAAETPYREGQGEGP